jgi:hypothetical protein
MKIFYLLFLVTEILSTNPEMEKENKNILISIYENLFLKYPKVDVKPEDFINHLSPDSENYKEAWISITLTVIFGLLVYIIPIYLTERDHIGPYPLWLHNFYCAADFMGIWVFLEAYKKYNYFLFALLSIGEGIWVLMEIFCLQRSIKYESHLYWKNNTPLNKKICDILIQIISFFAGLNLLRFELNDVVMWKFWIFTQVFITIIPGLELEKRGYRKGNNMLLHLVFICVAFVSFNPWCNMWKEISPKYFSIEYNPWYYIIGFISFIMSIRGLFIYLQLPDEKYEIIIEKKIE